MANSALYDSSLFSHPELECDVIMKGGITSGVVYPLAVCELAQKYRFRSIGGTSAGAIAAALTAAAELGRTSPRGGFPKLAELPKFLEKGLLPLFQPSPQGRAFFKILLTWIGAGGRIRKVAVSLVQLILRKILWFLIGAGLGCLVVDLLIGLPTATIHPRRVWTAWVVFALGGGILSALAGLVLGTFSALRGNLYGLCNGNSSGRTPALTPWLAGVLEQTAGRDPAGPPLTFGDLWGKDGEPEEHPEDRKINFEVMTTNLTWCRPMRLPFATRELFFDPKEMGELFPELIVTWLLKHPAPARPGPNHDREQAQLDLVAKTTPYRHLPAPADLPVIVAARMSLSFPVLFSAVPLYAVDWSRKANAEAQKEGRAPVLEKCWFSDGGIGSNFPVHFFDGLLPGRPTFGINLRPFHPDYPKQEDESQNVWFPSAAGQGMAPTWRPITGVLPFVGAILNTMQNWVDTAQMRLPGYRDRVIHVSLTPDEGGMNLNMPEERITALSTRGKAAGHLLATAFDWEGHRWTRYLSAMGQLQEKLETMDEIYEGGFADFLRQHDPQVKPYRQSLAWKAYALQATQELMAMVRGWGKDPKHRLTEGSPRPEPDLRIMPRL